MERKGKLEELDRSFDFQFWQAQSPQVWFAAMWELILHAEKVKWQDVCQHRLLRIY